MKPWEKPNDSGEYPGDICCMRASGKYCYEHNPVNYPEHSKSQNVYMLIIIKSGIDPQYAVVGAAHASLAGYLKWQDDELTNKWANGIFYKHVKMATADQFEKAKDEKYGDKIIMTESCLDGEEVAIVYRVKEDYSTFLKTLPKWKMQAW